MVQVPLSVVRKVAVSLAKKTQKNYTTWPETGFVLPDPDGETDNDIRCSLVLNPTTLNPKIMGVVILVENYFCDMRGVKSYIDFTVAIENVNNVKITQSQIFIQDIEEKLWEPKRETIRGYIANNWNKSSRSK